MMKWEYKITDVVSKEAEKILNSLGQDGWEAVGLHDISGTWIRILLKRVTSNEPALLGIG